jgi:type III secretion protein J
MRSARLLMVASAACVLVGCTRAPLYSALTEGQANEVQAALLSAHIDADKVAVPKSDLWSVSVAHGEIPQAMAVLSAAGLPRQQLHTLGDVFPKEGFVSSPLEERARYVFALSQEVQHTLMQLDGVVDARVHIALPDRNLLDDKPQSASASVVIIERPGASLESRETDIKAIVTDGIEGLRDINRVTVKFFIRRMTGVDEGVKHADSGGSGSMARSASGNIGSRAPELVLANSARVGE